ncbi:MAG: hypothetical protein H7Y20_18930 [Bryobacteraceae bacterium]|nr:hypothetical protein [Bryobacteraceae bacterium]
MEWNRSETLALAANNCKHCEGLGLPPDAEEENSPCRCVLRAIFRACYKRFSEGANEEIDLSRSSPELGATQDASGTWSRKNEEYVADFMLLAKRTLNEDEHKLFRFRYILGADWHLCSRKLGMNKGVLHHSIYRIQEKLGRVFRELQPYPLYPVRDYFTSSYRHREHAKVVSIRPERTPVGDLFPLKKAA